MLCYMMWHALQWPEAMSFCVTLVELCCSLLNHHREGPSSVVTKHRHATFARRREPATLWTCFPMRHLRKSELYDPQGSLRLSLSWTRNSNSQVYQLKWAFLVTRFIIQRLKDTPKEIVFHQNMPVFFKNHLSHAVGLPTFYNVFS